MKKMGKILSLLMLVILFSGCVFIYDPADKDIEFRNYNLDIVANKLLIASNKNISNAKTCAGNLSYNLFADSVFPLANCIAYKMVGTDDEIKNDSVEFAKYCLTTAYNYLVEKHSLSSNVEYVDPYLFGEEDNGLLSDDYLLYFYSKDENELVAFPLVENETFIVGGYNGEVAVVTENELRENGYRNYMTRECKKLKVTEEEVYGGYHCVH